MRRKPPRRFLLPALLVAAAFGVVPAPAQSAPPVSIAASDTPKDASAWSVMPIDELRQRANKNEVGAMEELGRRLLAGDGVPRDVQTGATWFQLAANAGSPMSAFTLGVLYERGISVERDSAKAVDWYRKAAAGNVAAAKHNLALMLRDGKGVAQDGPKALELLRQAAHQGMTASMFTLGDMYERGGAVLKDPAAALAWFSIAHDFELKANNGNETPLAKSAQARGQALEQIISGTDRERTEKIGKDEFRQIVVALTPPRPPPRTLPLPPMPSSAPSPTIAAAPSAPAATPSPPAAVPSAPAEEPQPAWPPATVDQVKAVQQALIDLQRLRGKADGAAGPATKTAIREFEKSAGLPETGQVSREVYLALVKAKAQHDVPAPTSPATPAPPPTPAATPSPPAAATPNAPVEEPQSAWPQATVDQVKAVQQALIDLQRLRGKADGAAGPATKTAIREFEKSAGMPETGQASHDVYLALVKAKAQHDAPAPTPPPTPAAAAAPAPEPDALAWPAKSADQIRAIQQLLVELKLLNAEPTGTVGPLTKRAIRDYQKKSGLKETGEPSQALFESLKAARAKTGG